MDTSLRGTGRTTRQMASLPEGAVFVWCDTSIGYPLSLARSLGKRISVVSRGWLSTDKWRGRDFVCIEVDHALQPTPDEMKVLLQIAQRQLTRSKR